jgi:hypothetical protein
MKIKLFFLSLFLILGFVQETQCAQENVYNLLISGETKQLKKAAIMIAKGKDNTPENALFLATILENEFENAPIDRIDALSWSCTALGSTGDSQYKFLLKKIYESKAHKKLRKYANKAYKRLPSTMSTPSNNNKVNQPIIESAKNSIEVSTLIDLPFKSNIQGLVPKASLTAVERKIFAIAKSDWNAIKFISQQLDEPGLSNTKLLDTLSQFLYEMQKYNLDSEKIDILAWVCRKLGRSKNKRYKTILQNITNQTTYEKLRKYAKSATKKLTNTSTAYVIGNINFDRIIDEFKI